MTENNNFTGLYQNIGKYIDSVLGNHTRVYETELGRKGDSLSVKFNKLCDLIRIFHIGMLIIDEIELISMKQFKEGTIETFMSLSNQTGIAIASVGTEDAFHKLFRYERITRRMGNLINADAYCSNPKSIYRILNYLYKYMLPDNPPLSQESLEAYFKESAGTIGYLSKLFVGVTNPCGHIQEFYPKHFLNGQRCERCTELIAAEKIPEIVNYMTDGQYTVTHVGTNLCEFREKGGATVEISLAKFLQEVRRPTPSDILPVPIENLKEDWNDSIWKFYGGYQNKENLPVRVDKLALYREIRSWYKDDQLIFMEDLRTHFPESYYKTLKSGIKQLIKARLLFRIEPGIYTILIQKVTPLQLLREKYLVRNGKRIGIFDSKSLAYKMGLTDEKPDALYIMTNKESMEHGRRRIINGVPVHIRGNKLLIYEDNYKHIMVMEALKYCFHYDASRINRVLQFIKDNNLDLERFTGLMQFYSKNITNMFMKIWRQYNESDN